MRTLSQIYNQIIAQKESMSSLTGLLPSGSLNPAQTLLTDLQSSSKVAIWRLIAWVVAYAIWVHEGIVDVLIAEGTPGTLANVKKVCLAFQYGDALVEQNGKYLYSPVDTANQIVKYCSITEDLSTGQVTIKTAKDDGSGNPVALTTLQHDAFKEYMVLQRIVGTRITHISTNGDVLNVGYTVYYNPMVMAPDGSLLADSSIKPVEDVINNYIKNLPFDGVLLANQLDAQVLAATGVTNAVPTLCRAKVGSNPYTNILAQPDQKYRPFAGYLVISTAVGETLADSITYIADPLLIQ